MSTPEELLRFASYCAQNPEKRKATARASATKWREQNPGKAAQASREYRVRNPEKVKARNALRKPGYNTQRGLRDPAFKLRNRLSCLVVSSFKLRGWHKESKTQAMLGCSFDEFVVHLQSKFKEGMTLENHGDWHIDHIKPCATATNAEELAALFHFTNLQPLWASENLSKGRKYYE